MLPTSRFLWVMVHRFRHAVRRRATMLLWRAVYLGFFDMQWQRTWGKVSLTYPQTAPLLSYQCLSIVEAVLVAWEVRSLRHHPSCQSCLVHCCNRKPSHFVFFFFFRIPIPFHSSCPNDIAGSAAFHTPFHRCLDNHTVGLCPARGWCSTLNSGSTPLRWIFQSRPKCLISFLI